MMYRVTVYESATNIYNVDAESSDDAREQVCLGYHSPDHSRSIEFDVQTIEEIKDEKDAPKI